MLNAFVEASLAKAQPDEKFQFERNGYFVADRKDYSTAQLVFNLAVTLKAAVTMSAEPGAYKISGPDANLSGPPGKR